MTRSTNNPWLCRFAIFTAISTWLLIGLGGLVTSHGAGMAVPDWPTTYGYNMFLFPPSYWIGGVFYEHTHRLFASFVGLLTTILAVWLWLRDSRRSMRWLGVAAFITVVIQGVLGGLRVTMYKDQIGIFHGALAQSFLVLICFIALATTNWWQRAVSGEVRFPVSKLLRYGFVLATSLVFVQLILGASMRHQHAGLAIPDFPLAYGQLWPRMDSEFIESVNRSRVDVRDHNPIQPFHIALHMAHRIGALLTLVAVGWVAWKVRKEKLAGTPLPKLSASWFAMIVFQAVLGAATVWSNKAADVATVHVVVGAASLVLGAIQCLVLFRFSGRLSKFANGQAGHWAGQTLTQSVKTSATTA